MSAAAGARVAQDPVVSSFLARLRPFRREIKALYLFGSRARDDWRPDSDYDILVIVGRRDRPLVDRLYDAVLDVLLESGSLVSLKILTEEQYTKLAGIPTPFMARVKAEGVALGLDD